MTDRKSAAKPMAMASIALGAVALGPVALLIASGAGGLALTAIVSIIGVLTGGGGI